MTDEYQKPSIPNRDTALKVLEAALFASAEPLPLKHLAGFLEGSIYATEDAAFGLLQDLSNLYADRGIFLETKGEAYALRTHPDVAPHLTHYRRAEKKLSRAALETLAIIAYHQPVTRAEIEEIRGVALSKGTFDLLLEAQWIQPKGRRRSPGKPLTWGTTQDFLDHFDLDSTDDLPGVEELKAAGLLDSRATLAAAGLRAGEDSDRVENPLDVVDLEGSDSFADQRQSQLELDEDASQPAEEP